MKAFTTHKPNGINLVFPNGNSISTIWGAGSYTENHNYTTDDVVKDYTERIKDGSMNVEIMIDTPDKKLHNRIFRKLKTSLSNGVIGWVNMEQWLWVINQLSKPTNK